MTREPLLRIESVYIHPRDEDGMWGGWIDSPKAGDETDLYSVEVRGWALGRASRTVAIEFLHAGQPLGRVPINLARPDIPKAFPEAADALQSGFRASLNLVLLPMVADVFIQAVLADETRVPLAVISVRRRPITIDFQPQLQPILVTTLDDAGSSWLMRMLGEHPQITAYRPSEFEPRMLAHCLTMLENFADPARCARALTGEPGLGERRNASIVQSPVEIRDPAIQRWLGHGNIAATASFAMRRADDFYTEVARMQGKTGAVFFAEKCGPGSCVPDIARELCAGAKEVILVRDLRDAVCATLSPEDKGGGARRDWSLIRQLRAPAVRLLEAWRERGNAAHFLRCEDLVLRPEPVLRSLLEYLGLDAGAATISAMLARARSSAGDVFPKSIGRWRSALDETLQRECADAFGDLLEQFGYSASMQARPAVH